MLLQALNEVGGFTPESFDKCLEDKKLFNDINAVRKRANEEFKVESTPSFFVNGKPLVHPESVKEFEALLK
jgi:protein-disulfide isomerase